MQLMNADKPQTALTNWLRRCVKKPAKSQAGLARAISRNPSAVNRMLDGKRRFQVDEIPLMEAYFGEPAPMNWRDIADEPPDSNNLLTNTRKNGTVRIQHAQGEHIMNVESALRALTLVIENMNQNLVGLREDVSRLHPTEGREVGE
jgi:hypothetical protein